MEWKDSPVDVLVDLISNPKYGLGDSKFVARNFKFLAKTRAWLNEKISNGQHKSKTK
jgi:hypothetical protein